MVCYNCGCNLSEHDFCTACGVDVSLYKKIMHVSNMYYNEGLEKAGVRDLSGAVISLRQSLKFNKNHIEARNLLGLVYFELGEAVAALSEWVISKNLRPEKNIADDYIDMIQSNASRLDMMNQTSRKYNQAYNYCLQGSKDLAMIQLKKVLSLNPRLVRAHQLLALLFVDSEQWDKAKRELRKCLEIDRNNTLALRYMKEVDLVLSPDASGKSTVKRKSDDAVRYQSDNEIIIQPLTVKESKRSGVSTLLNIALGIIIGVAAVFFLIMPGKIAEVNNEANGKIAEIGNQLDDKNATIVEMEKQLSSLQSVVDGLNQELEGYIGKDGTFDTMKRLFTVASEYLETKDAAAAAESLEEIKEGIDLEQTSEEFKRLYDALFATVGPVVAKTYYDEGIAAYNAKNYTKSIESLGNAVHYNAADAESLYFLARSYQHSGDKEKAITTYKKVTELFPGTRRAQQSQNYVNTLSAN